MEALECFSDKKRVFRFSIMREINPLQAKNANISI